MDCGDELTAFKLRFMTDSFQNRAEPRYAEHRYDKPRYAEHRYDKPRYAEPRYDKPRCSFGIPSFQ